MSTEENKAMVHRIIEEVVNKGDLAVVDEVMASNYVYHFPGMEFKGPEGFKQFITMFRTAFPDLHVATDKMIAEGDIVAARFTVTGTFKSEVIGIPPTGKQMTITEAIFIRFEGGKEVEATPTIDRLDMFQQLGVIPPMGQGGG